MNLSLFECISNPVSKESKCRAGINCCPDINTVSNDECKTWQDQIKVISAIEKPKVNYSATQTKRGKKLRYPCAGLWRPAPRKSGSTLVLPT